MKSGFLKKSVLLNITFFIAITFLSFYHQQVFSENQSSNTPIGQFFPTSIIGTDDRCLMRYSSLPSENDQKLYGVGLFFNMNNSCLNSNNGPCQGTGSVVVRRDLVITAGHIFVDSVTKSRQMWKNFKFFIKVWVPPEKRIRESDIYDFESIGIKNIFFGNSSDHQNNEQNYGKDYAFVQLSKPVSEVVAGVATPKKFWINPLSFDGIDGKEIKSQEALSMGFHQDLIKNGKYHPFKSCVPFRLYPLSLSSSWYREAPHLRQNLLLNDGDFGYLSSGSPIVFLDRQNEYQFLAVSIGQREQKNASQRDFDFSRRFNFSVNGSSFHDEFVRFKRQMEQAERMGENRSI